MIGAILLVLLAFCSFAHADLRVLNTRHYTIHTDVEPKLAEDLARRMDAMFDEYERRLSSFKANSDVPQRFEVYIFDKKADYDRLTRNLFPNTGGIFMAGPRNLLAAFLEGQGRDSLRRTLQHEAFHQFAYTRIARDIPIWLNEGLAQLFEEGIWTGKEFLIGQVPPRRLRQLRADIKSGALIEFKEFVSMSGQTWSDRLTNDADAGSVQYNQAWAMVHFLVYGNADLRKRCIVMLDNLHNGEAKETAFERSFGRNYRGFQDRFTEWYNTLQPTSAATTFENQQVLADMLVAFNRKGQKFTSIDRFKSVLMQGSVHLRYTKGNLKWSSAADPKIYFADHAGRQLGPEQLYFDQQNDAPMPDLVRKMDEGVLRTRFWDAGNTIEHESVMESR